jgi:predicted enzyme related to lactoylglutathione lyase
MNFEKTVPILYAADVAASLSYYTNILGFENKWGWEDPPTFGGVSKDCVEIFFCEKGQGSPGTWLSVFVDNVDEYYEQIKAKGAKILNPPQSMDWNVREMLVENPDGHRIRFGHTIEKE